MPRLGRVDGRLRESGVIGDERSFVVRFVTVRTLGEPASGRRAEEGGTDVGLGRVRLRLEGRSGPRIRAGFPRKSLERR